jgi:hypothetical protein
VAPQHPEVEHAHETRVHQTRVTSRRTWSPAQFIAGIIGLLLTVMGGVALARLLPTESLTAETTTVFGVGHTTLMAMLTLGLGLLYLAEAGAPFDVQPGMIFLGVISLAFGLIVVIEPGAFDGALGLGETGGWFYSIIGIVSALTGIIPPTLIPRRND